MKNNADAHCRQEYGFVDVGHRVRQHLQVRPATVTATPRAKANCSRITGSLPIFVRAVPILLPIMVIDRSALEKNRPNPITIISAPTKKVSSKRNA